MIHVMSKLNKITKEHFGLLKISILILSIYKDLKRVFSFWPAFPSDWDLTISRVEFRRLIDELDWGGWATLPWILPQVEYNIMWWWMDSVVSFIDDWLPRKVRVNILGHTQPTIHYNNSPLKHNPAQDSRQILCENTQSQSQTFYYTPKPSGNDLNTRRRLLVCSQAVSNHS